MYLDHEGIVSLHGQISQNRLVERTRTVSSSSNKSGTGDLGVGILGARVNVSGGIASSERYEVYERTAPADEHLLLELEAFLAADGGLTQVTSIRPVAELYAKGTSAFVTGILRFRWASTHSIDPVQDATVKQMVEFQVDTESYDDGGMLSLPVRLAGNLEKCVSRKNLHDGSISPTSHLAVFLRALSGKIVPLGFFAHMQPLQDFIYLKPYAIWFA
jgi:hypothetical protein